MYFAVEKKKKNSAVPLHSFMSKWLMVFSATFSNISVISWRPVLLVEETGVPGENHRSAESH